MRHSPSIHALTALVVSLGIAPIHAWAPPDIPPSLRYYRARQIHVHGPKFQWAQRHQQHVAAEGSPCFLSKDLLALEEDSDVDVELKVKGTDNSPSTTSRKKDDHDTAEELLASPPPSIAITSTKPLEKSTGQTVLDLAVPALGALLIDPLMTVADTAFVGRFSTEPQALAGMGSAAALLTFCFYLFGFLTKVTTPLVSVERAAGNASKAQAVAGQALSLALVLGSLVTVLLWTAPQPLLQLMGTDQAGPAAVRYARDFLWVRALAAPAVLVIAACTGILRGYLDTKTPIVILVLANALNLALDVVLIAVAHLGPMGAAIATTATEWITAALLLAVVAGKLPSADGELGRKESGTITIFPTLSVPEFADVQPLVIASSSVFVRSLVLQLAISSAAAFAARNGGDASTSTTSLAAHQIGLQVWLLCSFVADALAAAAQGLVADARGRHLKAKVREIVSTVFVYSIGLGTILGSVLYVASFATSARDGGGGWLLNFFTPDASIQQELARILPLIVLSQPLNSYVFAADGVLEGASEFAFQAQSMLISVLVAFVVWISLQGIAYGNDDALVQVWTALIVLQAVRGITSTWKIVQKEGPIDLLALQPSADNEQPAKKLDEHQ